MARTLHRFSDRGVKAAKPGMFCDGGGLYLQVTDSPGGKTSKSWLFRFKSPSLARERQMGLGSIQDVGLAEARAKAAEGRKLLLEGVDPIEARQARKMGVKVANAKTMTFAQCAASYIAAHQPGWRNAKHAAQWEATLSTYVSPTFGALPVEAVDTALVMKALELIWTTKPETASRVRGRVESILAWATVRGRQGPNPAQWKNHLDHLLPSRSKVRKVKHHAALPWGEMPKFMVALSCRTATAARALEFVILTAARTSEVIGARWSEIDLDQRLWTVPANRMKGGREHRVPLSAVALGVLERMATVRMDDFIFPGERAAKLSNMALLMLLRRMGRSDLTAHGFRSSFRDWVSERTNFSSEVVEMALAHTVGSKVEAAYRRGDLCDKRRRLMDAWGEFCMHGHATAHVVSLRQEAS
ncbi:MAG: putative prophage CPS-53 integrase [Beijerinckiaceae bacterium]|nr:MAG: putative prophage CPS-53 integrase [Beijerinckiaceae bacterium]